VISSKASPLKSSFAWSHAEDQRGEGLSRRPSPLCNPLPLFYASIFAPLSADCESSAYLVSAYGRCLNSFSLIHHRLKCLAHFRDFGNHSFYNFITRVSALRRKLTRRFRCDIVSHIETSRLSGSFRLSARKTESSAGERKRYPVV